MFFLVVGVASGLWRAKLTVNQVLPCAIGDCTTLPSLAVENDAIGVFENQMVKPPNINLAQEKLTSNVLGDENVQGEKHIYVDLKTQTLTAYDGETLFMEAAVSTGIWNRTPIGDYIIWVKMRATRMSGGSGADAYNLPNVPYVMFFYNAGVPKISGYSLHGAYWHNNFGHPMSHGCVNMRQIDAEKLYNWATPTTTGAITYVDSINTGTTVTIY